MEEAKVRVRFTTDEGKGWPSLDRNFYGADYFNAIATASYYVDKVIKSNPGWHFTIEND